MPTKSLAQAHGGEPAGAGEATPLLAQSAAPSESQRADEESGGGALAPPPAAAPPPPPTSSGEEGDKDGGEYSRLKDEPNKSSLAKSGSQQSLDRSSKSSKSGKSGRSGKSKRRKKSGGDASVRSGKSKKEKKEKKKNDGPQKSCFHLLFDAVRYLAVLASFLMFAQQAVPLLVLRKESTWLQIAVRSYLAIFCLSFMIAESRIPFLKRISSPHDGWVLRGFLYSFVGLVGMEQDIAIKATDIASLGPASILGPDYGTLFATLYMSVSAWIMIGAGALYAILGMLCLQGLYEKMEKGH
ncbi:hypothetical protein ACHAWF_003819, partial [Thalassiosira exigua]